MNYQNLANIILLAFGGKENVSDVSHCITRLRVTCKDLSKVNKKELREVVGVQGLIENEYEIQVIIGTDVMSVYNEFVKLVKIKESVSKNTAGKKLNFINSILMYLSGSIIAILPILCCAAVIGTVCTIMTTFFGVSTDSGTYLVFNTFYTAFYDYLPVFVGFGAAKALGVNGFYGALLGAVLVHGNINGVEGLDFLGISVPAMAYGSTITPILLGVAFMRVVDKYIGENIPKVISFIFRPFVVLAISIPVTLIILGPLGMYIGDVVAVGVAWIHDSLGFFAVGIMAFILPVLIASGMGNAILPIFLQLFLLNGYEAFMVPAALAANISIGGAVLAVAFKTKNESRRQAAIASGFTAICGITEPAIYGLALPLRKTMLAGMSGAAIAGLIAGILQVKMYGFNAAGLVTLPLFMNPDGSMTNFYMAIIVAVIAVVAGFLISYFVGFDDNMEAE